MPFLLAQWLLLIVVLLVPKLVHFGENAAENTRATAAPVSNEEIDAPHARDARRRRPKSSSNEACLTPLGAGF